MISEKERVLQLLQSGSPVKNSEAIFKLLLPMIDRVILNVLGKGNQRYYEDLLQESYLCLHHNLELLEENGEFEKFFGRYQSSLYRRLKDKLFYFKNSVVYPRPYEHNKKDTQYSSKEDYMKGNIPDYREYYASLTRKVNFFDGAEVYSDDDESEFGILDTLMVEDVFDSVYDSFLFRDLFTALKNLSDTEREVLLYRFGFFTDRVLAYEEVAKIMKMSSRERVRQIEGKSLMKLRSPYISGNLKEWIDI